MAKSNTYYCSILCLISLATIGSVNVLSGQGNCLVYPADSDERIACELSYRALEYPQGSQPSQLLFDAAIRIGPNYAWAYYEKSVPFFKRGLLAEGVSLINKAIELEPRNYLYYRAYWYFYNRSYEYCISDLEELYTVHQASYVTTPSGELEMRVILALAHAQSGDVARGIYWMLDLKEYCEGQPSLRGYYDHFCLGLLYYMDHKYALAESEFEKQINFHSEFADTYYYLGLIKARISDFSAAEAYWQQALAKFKGEDGGYSVNFFTEFNINQKDVEDRLDSLN